MSDTTTSPTASDTTPGLVPGGQVDDPVTLRTDDFGLGGSLQDQLVRALTERWNPDDPGATTLPDDDTDPPSADTAATPAPAPDPSATDPSTAPTEDGAGGGRAAEPTDDGGAATPADGGAAAPAPDPTAATTEQEAFDLAKYARDYFGTDLTREDSQRLFSMLSRLQSLSPQEQAWMDQVLSGGQPGQFPATLGQAPQQPVVQQPVTPPPGEDVAVATLGPRPEDEYAAQQWDLTARAVRAQQAQIDSLNDNIARTTQVQLEQQRAQAEARVTSACNSWRDQYKVLTDGEFDGLVQRAAQTQTLPALIQHHHGDIEAATNALLEQQFWADPNLRQRAIANVASGRQAGDTAIVDPASPVAQQQAAADQGRQALAASVAGGGGSVTPQTSAVPSDPQQKRAAMVAELAASHDFTQ